MLIIVIRVGKCVTVVGLIPAQMSRIGPRNAVSFVFLPDTRAKRCRQAKCNNFNDFS